VEPDLAVEAAFWLSLRGLLLVDWRREAVSQLLWSDKDREVWFFLEKNHEKVYRFGLHQLRCVWQAGLAHFGILFWPTPWAVEV
jgi:hypothetical protein